MSKPEATCSHLTRDSCRRPALDSCCHTFMKRSTFCNLHVPEYETIGNRCHVIIISFIRTFSLNILIQFRTTPNKRYEHSFSSFSLTMTIVSRSLLHFIKLTTRACRNNYFSVGVLLSVKVNCRKKKHFLLGIHHVWLERLVVISKIYLQNLKNIVSLC